MKTRVRDATIEEIIHDICYHEDPDAALIINSCEDGGVFISDQEWRVAVSGETMKKALIRYQLKYWERYSYTREQAKEDAERFALDWSSEVYKMKK